MSSFDRALGDFADVSRREQAQLNRQQLSDHAILATLSGNFLGTLIELAESRSPIVLITRGGSHHRGAIVAVGTDVVALAPDLDGKRILLATRAIEAIRGPGISTSRAVDDVSDGADLATLLDQFGEDSSRVALLTTGGNRLMGRILGVGVDQLTLRLDGFEGLEGEADAMTISLAAIDEVVIEP